MQFLTYKQYNEIGATMISKKRVLINSINVHMYYFDVIAERYKLYDDIRFYNVNLFGNTI